MSFFFSVHVVYTIGEINKLADFHWDYCALYLPWIPIFWNKYLGTSFAFLKLCEIPVIGQIHVGVAPNEKFIII